MRTRTFFAFAALWTLGAVVPSGAAPSAVEAFEALTWKQLQQHAARPTAIVFTATYCANCPAVIGKLADALHDNKLKGEVIAVVIDAANENELLKSDHYTHASRLFLFEGNEAALRYQVDPRWRGVTPYIALIDANGKQTFVTGAPSDKDIAAWLQIRAK